VYRPLGLVCLWILLVGLAAPVDRLQRHIAVLEAQRGSVGEQERALMARQEQLSGVIKQLKTESRTRFNPFTARKIENALQELRGLLVELDALDRQEAALTRELNEERARLRSAIREEVIRLVADAPSPHDEVTRHTLRALLDAYPTVPAVLPPAKVREWPTIPAGADPDMITERATLLRYERERQDVTLRQIESIHALLQEERGLYQSVDDPNPDSLIRQQALTRRIEEIVGQIAASRQEIRALDDTLQRLEERLTKTGRAP
jgi:hypothetical protein